MRAGSGRAHEGEECIMKEDELMEKWERGYSVIETWPGPKSDQVYHLK